MSILALALHQFVKIPLVTKRVALGLPLLDCFLRLLRLLDEKKHIPHLASLITREIFYRVLRGDQGTMLRQACSEYGRTAQIVKAIAWIRKHYRRPFSAAALAAAVNMSPTSLNRHFRIVTAMSPLQFLKQVRLQESRRLLLIEGRDAATTAFEVGYGSPSQFSREYARVFGNPPIRDVAQSGGVAEQLAVR